MPYKNDSTHAKNIANFAAIIDILRTFGPDYQPANPAIGLDNLQKQLKEAESAQQVFNQSRPLYSDAVDKQQLAFENLSSLTTSVANAFKAAGTTPKAQETLLTVTRKLKGQRATPKKATSTTAPKEEAATGEEPTTGPDSISAAQMGYANRIDNFALMVETLKTEPSYSPNEAHLTIVGLEQKLEALKQSYREVSTLLAPLQVARDQRNRLLYTPGTGLIDTVRTIKAYIKSIYKSGSAQYRHVAALRFINRV